VLKINERISQFTRADLSESVIIESCEFTALGRNLWPKVLQ
jgi:hypothetical protein